MGLYHRQDFSAGWDPSADLLNGPPNGYLRGDNLVLDDKGALTVRRGIMCVSGADPLITNGSVHSLFTTTIDGFRHRYAGINDTVWRSETVGFYNQILSNLDGSGDIAFGSDLGQVLIARGTSKFKNDGTSSRVWGIPTPGTPSLSALESDQRTFSSFDDGENPAWVAIEGTVTAGVGFDDATVGARAVTPAPATGKGVIRRVYGAPQDFQTYDGGDTGVDEDLVEFYAWFSRPTNLEYMSLMIDVNGDDASDTARFRDDYYFVEITLDSAIEMNLNPEEVRSGWYEAEGFDREDVMFRGEFDEHRPPRTGRIRRESTVTNVGWARFAIPRGKFIRIGSTPTKNWSTVKALQIEFKYALPATTAIPSTLGTAKFDRIRVTGGSKRPLTGKYKAIVQAVAQFDKYQGKSPASVVSPEIELQANGLRLRVTLPAGFDSQVTQLHAYIMGGSLDGFYRAATRDVNPGSVVAATYNIDIEIADRDILTRNQRLDPSIQRPPDNIIDIAGPFDQRLFVATNDGIYPSLRLDLDAYSSGQVLTHPAKGATVWWMKRLNRTPYLGTSRGIFVVEGDGSVSPDGIINYRYRNLDVPPPIGKCTAQEGNLLVYIAADGPRIFNGVTSEPVQGNLDLLYQGYTRYGVPPPDLGASPGRFSAAIFNNKMHLLVPEGSFATASPHVHVLNGFKGERQGWDRQIFPRSFQVLYREEDGKVLAGDSSGSIFQLEALSNEGDEVPQAGVLVRIRIPIEYWTISDHNQDPLVLKEPEDLRMDLVASAGDNLTVDLYPDAGNTLKMSAPFHRFVNEQSLDLYPISQLGIFRSVQLRCTGSFFFLTLRSWSLGYLSRPPVRARWDSGYVVFGTHDTVWVRELRFLSKIGSAVTFRVLFDDVELTNGTFAPDDGVYPAITIFKRRLPKEIYGTQLRIILTTSSVELSDGFEPYWLEIMYRVSGRQGIQKKMIKIGGDKSEHQA